MIPVFLVGTWNDGLFAISGERQHHELAGHAVRSLTAGPDGSTLAIVDSHQLRRRARDGTWTTLATSELELACCLALGEQVHVGTDDARLLRLAADHTLTPLRSFDAVDGRSTWYAGSAIVNGQRMGPPLGVRSLSGTANGATLLVNVHVGGIPRSTDGGLTWHPTIDIDADVHEVRVHPHRPEIAMAAAAVGLCSSRDGGATWRIEHDGLHARYCSAVAFVGNDVLVAASADHFAPHCKIYRRPIDNSGELRPVTSLPTELDGIVDTACIATHGPWIAIGDRGGNLYTSTDRGQTWSHHARGLPSPSSILVCEA